MKTGLGVVIGVLTLLALSNGGQAAVRYVSAGSTNPVAPYTNWATAAAVIQDAVDVAVAGDTVLVTNGVYTTGGRVVHGAMTNRVVVDKAIIVQSVNGPAETVIQGNQVPGSLIGDAAVRCVYLTNGALLAGFTIRGGGTRDFNADYYLERRGGGVWGTGFILDKNNGVYGPAISNCVVSGNAAHVRGGGVCDVVVWHSVIVSNLAVGFEGFGGGAANSWLSDSVVAHNTCDDGWGGGTWESMLINCTVTANSASWSGGGVFGSVVANSIVYNNTPDNYDGDEVFPSSMVHSCTTPLPAVGDGNISMAPLFVDSSGGNYRLSNNSSCINAGDDVHVTSGTDLDGNPRIVGGAVDLGAYEVQPPPLFVHTQPATQITLGSATLNGMALPNGTPATAWFEWGTNGTYHQTTSVMAIGSGTQVQRVSASISGLVAGTVVRYRLVASNEAGIVPGAGQRFVTGGRLRAWGGEGLIEGSVTNVPSALTNAVGIAAGMAHNLVLRAGGTVTAWGYNGFGQTNVPAGLNDAVAVEASGDGSYAVRQNRLVSKWGLGPALPANLTNVVALSAEGTHALALRADGTVQGWQNAPADTNLNVPPDLTNVVAVTAGGSHGLALRADGTVTGWGYNFNGQLDLPAGLTNVVAILAEQDANLALLRNGTMVGWGSWTGLPGEVPALSNVVDIAMGLFHGLALRDDGTVISFGSDSATTMPVPATLTNAVAVSVGWGYSLALFANSAPVVVPLHVSGAAEADLVISLSGADADGDPMQFRISTLPGAGMLYQYNAGVRGAAIISPGTLVSDAGRRVIFAPAPGGAGTPYAVFSYTAGDGLRSSGPASVTVDIIVAEPFAHTLAAQGITANVAMLNGMATPNGLPSTAWFEWGPRGSYTDATPPVPVGDGHGVVHQRVTITNLVRGVDYQCCLVVSNAAGVRRGAVQMFASAKRVRVWGENLFGQTNVPPALGDVVAVSGGGSHSLVLRADGSMVGWGRNNSGQTDVPAGLSNVVAIAAGGGHNLALKSDGTVAAWGGTGTASNVPPGLSNVVVMAAGGHHNLALKADGTVVAWGLSDYGQTNIPAGLSNVVGVAAGFKHSVILRNDGTVLAWGLNEYGPTNIPAGVSNVVDLAAGYSASMARKADGTVVVFSNLGPLTNVPPALTNTAAVACGSFHGLAMTTDGALVTWGFVPGNPFVPPGLSNAVAAAAGGSHSLALVDNIPPVAAAQTAAGPANHDLVIALAGTDADTDPVSFRVISLPASGALYQFAGGSRGALIASPETTVSDSLGRVIFAPVPAEFGEPYASFAFVAHDGLDDSPPASVTLNIVGRPYAHALAPTELTRDRAVLNGVAVPNGFNASAWFEWGTGGNFTNRTGGFAAGSGSAVVSFSVAISNFVWGVEYQFRLVVSNEVAVTYGFPQALLTGKRLRAWGRGDFGQTNVPQSLSNVVAVAAGAHHNLGIKAGGTVVAWGWNNFGQTNIPGGLSNAVAVAAGLGQNIAVRTDGTVVAWAGSGFNDTNVPPGLSNVVQVSAGDVSGLALQADGLVAAWGSYWSNITYAPMFVPAGLSNVVMVSAGNNFFVALKADGTLAGWGWAPNGETNLPPGLNRVVAVAAGGYHALALKADGTVVAWGANNYGQSTVPPGLSNVVSIAAKGSQSFALKLDGTLASWGQNGYGQLDVPAGLNYIAAIFAGQDHTLALTSNSPPAVQPQNLTGAGNTDLVIQLSGNDADGDALAFIVKTLPAAGALYQYAGGARGTAVTTNDTPVTDGAGRVIFAPVPGELGSPYASFQFAASDGDMESASAVVVINEVGPVAAFTLPATEVRLASATLNGFVAPHGFASTAWFEWGTNLNYGQTGVALDAGSGSGVRHVKQSLAGLAAGQVIHFRLVASNASQVIAGADQRFVTGGKAGAWGDDSSGQSSVPPNLGAVGAVAGGLSHSLALRTDGIVAAWGNNAHGQTNVPASLANVAAVAAGGFHNLALLANGTVAAWGRNNFSQTNVPAGATNGVAVAAGGQHCLVLRADGSLVVWGDNSQGQRTVPASLTNVVGIAAGWYHNVALRGDGTVTAWGANTYGQTNVPPGLTNVIWVGAGLYHSLALRGDGSLVAWGLNTSGQTNVPAALTNTVAAACGGSHNLTLRGDDLFVGWGNNYAGQATLPAAVSNVVNLAAGGSHSLAVMVADFSPPEPPEPPVFDVSGSGFLSGGEFQLVFTGTAGAGYHVWASTNLMDWELLGPASAAGPGWFVFEDLMATNWPRCFYRATAP